MLQWTYPYIDLFDLIFFTNKITQDHQSQKREQITIFFYPFSVPINFLEKHFNVPTEGFTFYPKIN